MCVVIAAAGVAAGGAVAGGVISSQGAKSAAKAQVKSGDAAIDEQHRQYDLTRSDQAPWMQAGTNALAKLQNPQASFAASPGYDFRRSEGMRGIQQTAAARGGAFSGNALKALAEFNGNLASSEYGSWWNQQAGLAGVGQNATNAVGQFGQNAAGNIGNALMNQGDARASGIIGSTNALTGAIAGASDAYSYFKRPSGVNDIYSSNYRGPKASDSSTWGSYR